MACTVCSAFLFGPDGLVVVNNKIGPFAGKIATISPAKIPWRPTGNKHHFFLIQLIRWHG